VSGRALLTAAAAVLSLGLGACGEKPQSIDQAARRSDTGAWTMSQAANPAFAAPGWKGGEKAAWEQQIRQRNQAQNDYLR
jgi:hypothetical protein